MTAADGRRRRRDRNREAVVDALLGLIREGDLAPSAEAVATSAGLSARSVFRYFDDLDDLCRAGIARQLATVGPFIRAETDADGSADERVSAVVGQRVRLFDAMGGVGTFARLRAPFQPLVAEQLAGARRLLRDRLRSALAPQLAAFDAGTAERVAAAADVLCSFESYHLLLDDHGRSPQDAAEIMTSGVRALLESAAVAAP